MTAIKPAGLEGFLRKPDPSIGALLIYGEEPDEVREMAAKAVKRVAGSLDDLFSVMVLQEQDMSADPARLADEVQSISMFGGAKAVWIKGADQAFLKSVLPVLEGRISGNLVVAEAGILARSSQLRSAFEKSQHAYIAPLYEAESSEIAALVEQLLAKDNLRISSEAVHRFIELAGTSRSIARREAEKLALYCLGQGRVSIEDVEAICGNDIGADPDDLADSVFGGEVEQTDRLYHALVQSGADAGRLLTAAHMHAMKLQDFRVAMEKGVPADQAMRAAKPPIFFKRQDRIRTQLRSWNVGELTAAGATLGAGVLAVRENAALGQAIASRTLLSVARQGLKLRQDR